MLQKLKDWVGWLYVNVILYYAGAALTPEELDACKPGGDRWTYWFRRSRMRLGHTTWVTLIVLTLITYTSLFVYNVVHKKWYWVVPMCFGYTLIAWLIPHILGYC